MYNITWHNGKTKRLSFSLETSRVTADREAEREREREREILRNIRAD